MDVASKVLFRPNWQVAGEISMAREIGEVVAIDGDKVTIEWNGGRYQRDRRSDFIREQL